MSTEQLFLIKESLMALGWEWMTAIAAMVIIFWLLLGLLLQERIPSISPDGSTGQLKIDGALFIDDFF